ncbi:angiopoietin-2b isoform X2 [Denticeps clupeoides]|uniref:angiopoietin-2b isoform X2 n=1 Tax=Denticeps clupeoides TaxID=299321 RepID=UPI0010A2F1E2|nr:angiopoietin-2-like isoform X2 [Denticeps clupeoides]
MGHLPTVHYLLLSVVFTMATERQQYQVQHGRCSYTFLLPEVEHCGTGTEGPFKEGKLEALENLTENNTQWLQKLENYIQENVRSELEEMHQKAIHSQTATMLEISSSLLSHSMVQSQKLTDVEMQVLSQTRRLEEQLQEYLHTTSRLEKHVLRQASESAQLKEKNRLLEQRFAEMEVRHQKELNALQQEKRSLQDLLEWQGRLVSTLEEGLVLSSHNSTQLQRQQADLTDSVQQLMATVTHCNEISRPPKDDMTHYRDCAEINRAGITHSGVYNLRLPNMPNSIKVFCDMTSHGGGWTVLQHRQNGSLDFHRSWTEYKQGFGDPAGEHWMGNDFIHTLTKAKDFSLLVLLQDSEGNKAHSHYEHFHIEGEEKNYSLHAHRFSGTAGKTSSLTRSGTMFSTKDHDNDFCSCKCAQMASGGWWFEACGASNLNGIYYSGHSKVPYNGIKWYYWKGPNVRVSMTTMMVRPSDF